MTTFLALQRLLTAAALVAGAATASAATITIACGASAPEIEHCMKHAEAWAKKTGHTVRNYTQPASATAALAVYRQLFAAKSGDIDIIRVDVIWPGILKDHLIDLKPYSKGSESEHFPAIVANNTVGGRLLGIPWFTDAGLLYYRTDLLQKYKRPAPTWPPPPPSCRPASVRRGRRIFRASSSRPRAARA